MNDYNSFGSEKKITIFMHVQTLANVTFYVCFALVLQTNKISLKKHCICLPVVKSSSPPYNCQLHFIFLIFQNSSLQMLANYLQYQQTFGGPHTRHYLSKTCSSAQYTLSLYKYKCNHKGLRQCTLNLTVLYHGYGLLVFIIELKQKRVMLGVAWIPWFAWLWTSH